MDENTGWIPSIERWCLMFAFVITCCMVTHDKVFSNQMIQYNMIDGNSSK
jgi:hypothetical protein